MKLEAAETRLLAVPSVGGGRGSQSQCTHTPHLSSCLPVCLSACPPVLLLHDIPLCHTEKEEDKVSFLLALAVLSLSQHWGASRDRLVSGRQG